MLVAVLFLGAFQASTRAQEATGESAPPLKLLLVTGGVSHDYALRQKILVQGIRERLTRRIEWVVRLEGKGEANERIPLFESSEWAKGYDLVVHDHCFPRAGDEAYVERVLAPHRTGVPAVLIHGTMFSFRPVGEEWTRLTGVEVGGREPPRTLRLEPVDSPAPFLRTPEGWELPHEELYRVGRILPGAASLLEVRDPAGKGHPVAWHHRLEPGGGRVFATTLGNTTTTLADPRFLDLVAEGVLWALGEEGEGGFRRVAPAQSLAGLEIPDLVPPLPRPGRNLLTGGRTDGRFWGSPVEHGPGLVNDGDPLTAWRPAKPGPGWWECRWEGTKTISRVVLIPEAPLSAEVTVELTSDGRLWREVGRLPRGELGELNVLRFPPGSALGLRVNLPSITPGGQVGLREVAAYASEEAVPAAILLNASPPPRGEERSMDPLSMGNGPEAVHVAAGWEVTGTAILPAGWRVSQVVPAADGQPFVLAFPEGDEQTGVVYRVRVSGKEDSGAIRYLEGVARDTRIAWDGEWLYTLSGRRLDRVRKALGKGAADERQRLGEIFRFETESAPADSAVAALEIGEDGWLWAEVVSRRPGSVFDREGRESRWPVSGFLRIRRDGGRVSETLRQVRDHPAGTEEIVEVPEGAITVRKGDQGWVALTSGAGGRLLRLGKKGRAEAPPVEWDELDDEEVVARLRDERADSLVVLEAAMEWQRRFRREAGDLAGLFAGAPADGKPTAAASALAGLENKEGAERLLELANSSRPDVQAAAYEAFGDLREAKEHPALAALGEITIPGVTAALFEALVRSQSRLPGSEAVAAALVDHADPGLAEAARGFLRQRGAAQAMLAAWDGKESGEARLVLSDLLSELPDSRVPGGLFQRIHGSNHPGERAALAGVLGSWYRERKSEGEESGRLEEVVTSLHGMLEDRRNDRPALLEAMDRAGVPFPPAEQLARYAMEDPTLEAFALGVMSRDEGEKRDSHAWPAAVENWLGEIRQDRDRDTDLRVRALCLLAGSGQEDRFREWFAESAALAEEAGPETRAFLHAFWRGRTGLATSVDWVVEQSRDRDRGRRILAWQILLGILSGEDGVAPERERAEQALVNAWADSGGAGETLRESFAILSGREKSKVLARGFASSVESLRTCAMEMARWAGRDPETGEEPRPIRQLPKRELAAALERWMGSADGGRGPEILQAGGCNGCHRPDGEGWGFGPDLPLAFAGGTLADFLGRLPLGEGEATRPGRFARYETGDGRRFEGWIPQGGGSTGELVDLAGNFVPVPSADLLEEDVSANSPSPCRVGEIDLAALSDLVLFLRSCLNF